MYFTFKKKAATSRNQLSMVHQFSVDVDSIPSEFQLIIIIDLQCNNNLKIYIILKKYDYFINHCTQITLLVRI